MKIIRSIFIAVIIAIPFYSSSIFAKAYKCTIDGKISYQSIPCLNTDITEEINIKANKVSSKQSCLSACSSEELICVSKLDRSSFKGNEGLNVCSLKKDWCEGICKKENKLDLIDKKHSYLSAKRNYKYNKAINKIDEKAKNRKQKRVYGWHAKRKREISDCIASGMVKIDALKIRSLAWKREKELKDNCKKQARTEKYGVY